MNPKDYEFLDEVGNIALLRLKGYRYIIPGEEYTGQELGESGYPDIVFVDATPIETEPEDPVPYRSLSKEGVCDDVLSYIVHRKYFV